MWNNRFLWAVGMSYFVQSAWFVLLIWRVMEQTHSDLWMACALALGFCADIVVGVMGPQKGGGRNIAQLVFSEALLFFLASFVADRSLAWLMITALVNGWLAGRITPLLQAYLTRHTPVSSLRQGSRSYELGSRIGILLGPVVAGWGLVHLPFSMLLLVFFALLLIEAILLSPLDTGAVVRTKEDEGNRPQILFVATIKYVLQDPFLGIALGVRGLNNLLWPAFTLGVPLLVVQAWHQGSLGFGILRSVWGFSTIVGTLWLVPRIGGNLGKFYFVSWMFTGMGFALLAWSPSYQWAVIAAFLGALASPAVHVALDTYIGEHVPHQAHGHVFAFQQFVMSGLGAVGLGVMALFYDRWPPDLVLGMTGGLMVLAATAGSIQYTKQLHNRQEAAKMPPEF